jgi:signal transduction histidine kinase/DNA-binding response OmpR family regulator
MSAGAAPSTRSPPPLEATVPVDTVPSRSHRGLALRPKFVLAISALVALVLAANATVQTVAGRRQLLHDIELHAMSYGTLAVRPLCEAYETYYASGYGTFRRLVSELLRLEADIARAALYDTSGRLLFDSAELADPLFDPGRRDGAAPVAEGALLAAIRGLDNVELRSAEGGLTVVVPYIEDWGRHRYSATFEVSYASLREATRAAAWRILLVSVGALAVGVGIAIVLARQSIGPVEALTRGAQDLADGRLDRRISLRTGDEYEDLAETFNLMATRLQRTVSELEVSNRELAELDRVKSDLLANVSHELRTPLTAIQGYTEALGDGLLGTVSDAQREALAVVGRNVTRLRGMIDQLLAYARLDAGAVRLELQAVDLAALAEQTVAAVRGVAPRAVALRVEAAAGLPLGLADPARLQQVFDNLLTNAVKFTSQGEVVVALATVQSGEAVEVAVRDTGIGIPREAQERIFDRFFQVDGSSKRRYGGMGLGLAIVREILAAHHTTISVESEPGKGSCFRFRLPVAPAGVAAAVGEREPVRGPGAGRSPAGGASPAGVRGPAAPAAVAGETGAGRRRLVLVDDDPVFLQTISGLLGRQGYEVATAGTLAGGHQLVRQLRPDLVLLDRLLPDGDGFDLLGQLAADQETRNIPVLLVSIRDERARGLALGAAGYLVKPIDPGALREAVLRALAGGATPGGGEGLSGGRVLVVDDEPDLRQLLAGRLGADGLEVEQAEGGEAALARLGDPSRALPDLVLLDLMMPDLDGWQVLARLRSQPRTAKLPVIVLTARDTPDDRATGSALEVVDYVHKPFDLGALVREIEQLLAGERGRSTGGEG